MNPGESLKVPSQVMSRQVGEETVLLDLASGTYFGLDPVGSRLWQLIVEGRAMSDICDALALEFDVTRDQLEHDVGQLVDELRSRGLVTAA